jgi:hypothetical protein
MSNKISTQTNLLKQTIKVDMNDIARIGIQEDVFAMPITKSIQQLKSVHFKSD